MVNGWRFTICGLAAATLGGCDGTGDRPSNAATEIDSAGVRIVESSAIDRPLGVRIDLAVGAAEATDETAFGRVADVAVDGQGRLFVLDQIAQHVVVLDASGQVLAALGGPGEGPGELSPFANGVVVAPDGQVMVLDPGHGRLTMFDGELAYGGSVPLITPPMGSAWRLQGAGILTYRGLTRFRDGEGFFRTEDALLRHEIGTDRLDTIMALDYPPTELGTRENVRIPLIVNAPFWTPLPGGGVAWGSLDQAQVRIHDEAGQLSQIWRHPEWDRSDLTGEDRTVLTELLRTKLLALGGDPGGADLPNVELWDQFPAITHIVANEAGTLFVQRMGDAASVHPFAVNDPDRAAWFGGEIWDVFSSDAGYLGSARLPSPTRVFRALGSTLYGVTETPTGAEQVVRLTIDGVT